MLSKRDGSGAIGVVLIATFWLLPEHQVCSALFFLRCYCYVFANVAFYNGFIAGCLNIAIQPMWKVMLANTYQ